MRIARRFACIACLFELVYIACLFELIHIACLFELLYVACLFEFLSHTVEVDGGGAVDDGVTVFVECVQVRGAEARRGLG